MKMKHSNIQIKINCIWDISTYKISMFCFVMTIFNVVHTGFELQTPTFLTRDSLQSVTLFKVSELSNGILFELDLLTNPYK